MREILFALILLAAPFAAQAELYKWVDADGKVHYSDQPPAGAKTKSIGHGTSQAPAAAADKKTAAKTLADKELEFNKRRQEAKEATAKKEKADADAAAKQENCSRARATLRALQEGTRMSTTNEKGERIVMDDDMRKRETARAQKDVDSWCK